MSIDRREHRPMLAVLLRFSSVVLFAIMSIGVKYLGGSSPVGQIIAVRSAIGAAAIVLIAWRTQSLHLLRTERWQSHALRSSVGMLAMFTWFLSLNFAPIAEATAVVYAGPIFGTLLAAVFLRERMRAHRWLAVALGFSGVVIMTGIHLTHSDSEALGISLALLCALFAALGIVFLRQMSRTEHALTTTFYFCLTSLVGAALTACWGWPIPSARDLQLLVLIGLLGTGAQFLMTAAFRYAEASIVVPIEYTGIVVVTVLGYVLFREVPGVTIWVGVPLVIAAGLLIVWAESRPGQAGERARTRRVACGPRTPVR
jgi:drug/metabolite transporter (DMT)-like permease